MLEVHQISENPHFRTLQPLSPVTGKNGLSLDIIVVIASRL